MENKIFSTWNIKKCNICGREDNISPEMDRFGNSFCESCLEVLLTDKEGNRTYFKKNKGDM